MKLILLPILLLSSSCAQMEQWTTPATAEQLIARDQRREARQRASDLRRAEDHRRQAEHEQRNQQEGLRNRFKRYSSSELKVMRARLGALVITTEEHTETLIDIDRELLRRWKAGDSVAHLPGFQ